MYLCTRTKQGPPQPDYKRNRPPPESIGRSKIFSFSFSNRVSTVTINNNIMRARRGRVLWRATGFRYEIYETYNGVIIIVYPLTQARSFVWVCRSERVVIIRVVSRVRAVKRGRRLGEVYSPSSPPLSLSLWMSPTLKNLRLCTQCHWNAGLC